MKAFVIDITDCPYNMKNELKKYADEFNPHFGQHTFMRLFDHEEDGIEVYDGLSRDLLPLTRAWVKERNTENLPVFAHIWW